MTHIIITQPTHEDRKAVLSCILRLASVCWKIGNFNTAVEILAGLKYVCYKRVNFNIDNEILIPHHAMSQMWI